MPTIRYTSPLHHLPSHKTLDIIEATFHHTNLLVSINEPLDFLDNRTYYKTDYTHMLPLKD